MNPIDRVVGANDVRGLVGIELTPEVVGALAAAIAERALGQGATRFLIGRDMRASGEWIAGVLADHLVANGIEVLELGLCSTDQLYFASGSRDAPAAMITASHNPIDYNGIKLCDPGARALSRDGALGDIAARAREILAAAEPAPTASEPGERRALAIGPEFATVVRSLGAPIGLERRLRLVVDAGNGMGGLVTAQVLGDAVLPEAMDVTVSGLNLVPDGSFPAHPPNPLDPANLRQLQAAVTEARADLGLAFDGDADRCVMVDERGAVLSPSGVGALVAERAIARAREAGEVEPVVVRNAITSSAVARTIRAAGGRAVVSRVGHAVMKETMRREDAVVGVEHSAHYYFRDFHYADSGILAALHLMAALAGTRGTASELVAPYCPSADSGEINSTVDDAAAVLQRIRAAAAEGRFGAVELSETDGLTVAGTEGDWWFNVRSSQTEPLLRLNVETPSRQRTDDLSTQVLTLIRAPEAELAHDEEQ